MAGSGKRYQLFLSFSCGGLLDLGWNAGGVDVFLADWTVGPRHFLHALVGVLEVVGETHVTLVAVEVVALASHLRRHS